MKFISDNKKEANRRYLSIVRKIMIEQHIVVDLMLVGYFEKVANIFLSHFNKRVIAKTFHIKTYCLVLRSQ